MEEASLYMKITNIFAVNKSRIVMRAYFSLFYTSKFKDIEIFVFFTLEYFQLCL